MLDATRVTVTLHHDCGAALLHDASNKDSELIKRGIGHVKHPWQPCNVPTDTGT